VAGLNFSSCGIENTSPAEQLVILQQPCHIDFAMSLPKAYPENAPGPFYVEHDLCILCGTPEAVAPNLVGMNSKHCYFKKQPESARELDQAIQAVESCCCGAYRYCGTDPRVIQRLGAEVCDNSGKR
jgi:hypothetical protein